MANNIPVTKAWVDNLGQTVREGKDYGQIIGKAPLTPEEYALQNARYDIERGAQMERPTYGMWNGETFISTDPNEIAEINARSEMRRTGLDRYYRPQSGAYFEAFNKIRDRYLQQELGKKAAVEAEGRAIVANRVGAFDKILQERAEVEKNKGLAELRKAQAKEAEARAKSYEGDGMTPKERLASKKDEKAKLAAMADDSRVQLLAKINDPATSTQDRATYIDAMNKINTNLDADFALIDKGEAPQHMKEFFKWQAFPSQYKPETQTGLAGVPINAPKIKAPVAKGVTAPKASDFYNDAGSGALPTKAKEEQTEKTQSQPEADISLDNASRARDAYSPKAESSEIEKLSNYHIRLGVPRDLAIKRAEKEVRPRYIAMRAKTEKYIADHPNEF